jgi:hypothetical protein
MLGVTPYFASRPQSLVIVVFDVLVVNGRFAVLIAYGDTLKLRGVLRSNPRTSPAEDRREML